LTLTGHAQTLFYNFVAVLARERGEEGVDHGVLFVCFHALIISSFLPGFKNKLEKLVIVSPCYIDTCACSRRPEMGHCKEESPLSCSFSFSIDNA